MYKLKSHTHATRPTVTLTLYKHRIDCATVRAILKTTSMLLYNHVTVSMSAVIATYQPIWLKMIIELITSGLVLLATKVLCSKLYS